MRILLVEDDKSLAELVKKALTEQQNYLVDSAKDGNEGLNLADAFEYDLILLDIVLPKLDGINVCKTLRNRGDRTPILLLTATDEISQKVRGLDAGADDYLVKPFNIQELLARVRALTRRGQDTFLPILQWENFQLDSNSCKILYRERELKLTAKEYALLELFLRNPHRIFSQSALIDRIWHSEESPSINAVRTQIKGLRQKLKAVGATSELIETIYGLGYRLKKEENRQEKNFGKTNPFLQDLWQKHQQTYLEKIELLKQYLQKLQQNPGDRAAREQAKAHSHTLAGSLGIFGWQEIALQFRGLTNSLNSWQTLTNLEQSNLIKSTFCLYESLQKVDPEPLNSTQNSLEKTYSPTANIEAKESLLPATQLLEDRFLSQEGKLLIVDDDLALVEALEIEAKGWGLSVEVAHNLSQAREIIDRTQPNAILLDLSFPGSKENGFELLQELKNLRSTVPVVVFTAKESFTDRVKVARLGGKGFLQKPILAADVIEAIAQVIQKNNLPDTKILVVDDDPETLDLIRDFLEPWGCELTLLEDPHQFWDTLEFTNPDLLILDVEMPSLSGIELCQVVRNEPRWQEIPILSLSNAKDSQTIQTVFSSGADDYINKPIVGAELVARVLNRLDRERYRRQIAEIDALTGVSNRRKSIKQLTRTINLAKRQNQPFCFIILDLDHFKKINDVYGHDAGDLVLRQLGKLLTRTFRGEDIIARWGGEEFTIGLYNMTKKYGIERLQKLLHNFSQQEFSNAYEKKFRVTFSVGVAQYPTDGEDLQTLYQSADAALYQAKSQGRHRVIGFGE
jgi:diguanylate cyclase (GGDEF)-like protein